MRISNSFSESEVQILEFVLQTLLRGGSPAMAVRNKDFPSLLRKVMAMKAKMEEKQRHTVTESSVGQIAAAPNDVGLDGADMALLEKTELQRAV